MSTSSKNIKPFPTRWQKIQIRKMRPEFYPDYYRRQPGFSQLIPSRHFFVNNKHSWMEVFYEQIETGFWLMALEIKAKGNNHYILQPKKSMESYYSINFLSTSGRLGLKENNRIQLVNNQVSLWGPETACELYQEEGTVVRCCRMIFTTSYMARLVNVNEVDLGTVLDLKNIMKMTARNHFHRVAAKAEIFLYFRLFNVLRYEQGKYHYRTSIFSNVFELTAFFLKLSTHEGIMERIADDGRAYAMLRAAKILEQQVEHKFPGVNTLALSCQLSPSKLKRDFKKVHGSTPLDYFRSLQIIYVTGLLNGREKTVKELSIMLGFKNSSAFSAWYRKLSEVNDNNKI